jgi:hypothetical protein
MAKRKKPRGGHFCWCCGRVRPNERFSGRGHARHLCRDCDKLGHDELAYRQAVRTINRMLGWNGQIQQRQRKSFERFLSHSNDRVREYAETLARRDAEVRAEAQAALDEQRMQDLEWERSSEVALVSRNGDDGQWGDGDDPDIPF